MLIYLQMISSDTDKSAFEQIYNTYRGLMYHVAYARLHHVQDAEDAVHHAFVKIAENIRKIDPDDPRTKQLVVTIVDNRITDMLRARGRHPECAYEDAINEVQMPACENFLADCILRLPDLQRQIIWLKYVHGYNLHEIAKMLGISMFCAQKADQRAKQNLKNLYENGGSKR